MRQTFTYKFSAFVLLIVFGAIGIVFNMLETFKYSGSFHQVVSFLAVSNDSQFYNTAELKLQAVYTHTYTFLEKDTGFKDHSGSEVKSHCANRKKRILWYDVHHGGTGVRNKARKVDFSKCECRCQLEFFIFKDTSTMYTPSRADAVLMQLNKLKAMGHPPLKKSGQVFVMVEREATPKREIPLHNFENIFNWTMTYRSDSDIFYPYGRIVERIEKLPEKNYSEIYRRKNKGIVWFVSHCKTRSKRELYAKELSKYIDLDIVGKCGKIQCPRHGKASRHCLPKFEEKYFFRFTFENTYHKDYVTEKLFEHFSGDSVQIVGGSANYSNIVPPHTVIDAKDYDSPKELAEYLKKLMASEDRYTEYLKSKENYYAETLRDQSQKAYCQLCRMLHNPNHFQKSYYSIGDWWVS